MGCLVVLLSWLREMLLLCAHSWAVDLTGCCLHTAGRWSQLLSFQLPSGSGGDQDPGDVGNVLIPSESLNKSGPLPERGTGLGQQSGHLGASLN